MAPCNEHSREEFLAQLARCVKGQENQHVIPAPVVPRADDEWGLQSTECLPEEPMGNQEPIVHCDTEHPSSIANPYDGSWA